MLNPERSPEAETSTRQLWPTDRENDNQERFLSLYSGWLEARAKQERMIGCGDRPDIEERIQKMWDLQQDFARRAGAIPTPEFNEALKKLAMAIHYAGEEMPHDPENPILVLLAGVRADLLALRQKFMSGARA